MSATERASGQVVRRVSASDLHTDTRPTLDLLQSVAAVAVTHYNKVECYLVAADRYDELTVRAEHGDAEEGALTSTVTVLLAAACAGVPIPSDMLETVMPGVDVVSRWREIADFAATFPLRMAAGEGGEPLTRVRLGHVGGPITEAGDDDLDLG